MYNYSMMYPMMANSMMMNSMYGYGNSYSGNAYINMRNRYGYPDTIIDNPPPPMSSVQRTPHVIVERNPVRAFLKKIFRL